jgi:NAD+ kinase
MKVGIVAQQGNGRAAGLAEQLRDRFATDGVEVLLDETTASTLGVDGVPVDRLADSDLAVSIGGDGTFLYAARGAGTTPLLGVNLGEVGFLNAVSPEDAVEVVGREVEHCRDQGSLPARELARLAVSGPDWSLPPALNEVVVQGARRGPGGGVEYAVRVDGSLYTGGTSEGLLVATPTGSTAYNLSEGGPLVHPGVDATLVTEMVASETMPPLVAPPGATVTVTVEAGEEAYAIADGRTRRRLQPPAEVTVEVADEPVRIAGPEVDFFEALGKLE